MAVTTDPVGLLGDHAEAKFDLQVDGSRSDVSGEGKVAASPGTKSLPSNKVGEKRATINRKTRGTAAAVAKVRALMGQLNVSMADLLAYSGQADADVVRSQRVPNDKATMTMAPKPKRTSGSRRLPVLTAPANSTPKYRNPETLETWDGKGRTPIWIAQAELRGYSRDLFLFED